MKCLIFISMTTIQQTVEIPADRRLHLDLDLSLPGRLPPGGTRLEIILMPSSPADGAKTKARTARQKLRELCKDSTLTVDSFLAMKHDDRVLEAAINERAGVAP
jgi:hypothetical protein